MAKDERARAWRGPKMLCARRDFVSCRDDEAESIPLRLPPSTSHFFPKLKLNPPPPAAAGAVAPPAAACGAPKLNDGVDEPAAGADGAAPLVLGGPKVKGVDDDEPEAAGAVGGLLAAPPLPEAPKEKGVDVPFVDEEEGAAGAAGLGAPKLKGVEDEPEGAAGAAAGFAWLLPKLNGVEEEDAAGAAAGAGDGAAGLGALKLKGDDVAGFDSSALAAAGWLGGCCGCVEGVPNEKPPPDDEGAGAAGWAAAGAGVVVAAPKEKGDDLASLLGCF